MLAFQRIIILMKRGISIFFFFFTWPGSSNAVVLASLFICLLQTLEVVKQMDVSECIKLIRLRYC